MSRTGEIRKRAATGLLGAPVLTLPITPEALNAIIGAEWRGDRGVAHLAGVDPERIGVLVAGDNLVIWYLLTEAVPAKEKPAADRGLSFLASALRDRGLVVDESSGCRVLGWAAVAERTYCGDERCVARHNHVDKLARVVDLDIRDDRRTDFFDEVRKARLARTPGSEPNGKVGFNG
jgi:hypothetical protein